MTPERRTKIERVIENKQLNLTIILENVDDPHNISAVLRSCDAVGIYEVFILDTIERSRLTMGKKSSASAVKWLTVNHFNNISECFSQVRASYDKIYATYLGSTPSISLYDLDLSGSVALLFGNEKDGVSLESLTNCDGNFIIPQFGMIQSLNISVACAVSLYEACRQRSLKDLYPNNIQKDKKNLLLEEWLKK